MGEWEAWQVRLATTRSVTSGGVGHEASVGDGSRQWEEPRAKS